MKWEAHEWADGPSPRRWHTFSPLPDHADQLFVFGGYDAPKHPLGDAFILDLGSQQWVQPTMKGDLPNPLCRHTLTALPGAPTLKQMILLGGSKNDGHTNKQIRILHTGTCPARSPRERSHLAHLRAMQMT